MITMGTEQFSGVIAAAAIAGLVIGWVTLELTVIRRARREAERLRVQRGRLLFALHPFVPIRVRTRYRTLWGFYPAGGRTSWRCDYHELLGGCFGQPYAGPAQVHDEAREHFITEHLTRAAFERARMTVEVVCREP